MLDDASGSTVVKDEAQNWGGVVGGATLGVAGLSSIRAGNTAASATGTSDITVPGGAGSPPDISSKQMTLSLWVNTTDTTATVFLAGVWENVSGPTSRSSYAAMLSSGKLFCSVLTEGDVEMSAIGTTLVNNGSWHHLACRYDGPDGNLEAWVDGVKEGSNPLTAGQDLATVDPGCPFQMFTSCDGALSGSTTVSRSIDEVALFARSLSATEITELYDAGVNGCSFGYHPVAYYFPGALTPTPSPTPTATPTATFTPKPTPTGLASESVGEVVALRMAGVIPTIDGGPVHLFDDGFNVRLDIHDKAGADWAPDKVCWKIGDKRTGTVLVSATCTVPATHEVIVPVSAAANAQVSYGHEVRVLSIDLIDSTGYWHDVVEWVLKE